MPPKMDTPSISTIVPSGSASTITITWSTPSLTGGSAILGYYVQRNSGYNSAFIEPGTFVAIGTNSYTFTSLVEGAFYNFRIAAVNTIYTTNAFTGDVLNFSDKASSIAALVPGQITTLEQLDYDYEQGKVKLAWTQPAINGSPIKQYTLSKDVGSGVFYPIYQGIDLSFTDVNLVPGQSYNYKIYATNGAGDGPVSTVLTGYAGEYPGKITSVTISVQSQTSHEIAYQPPSSTGGLPITAYWIITIDPSFVESAPFNNGNTLTYT